MKLAFIKNKVTNKDFCIDITKTIYALRPDLMKFKGEMSNWFYDFIIVVIDKNELGNKEDCEIYYFDIENIKDPTLALGINILKNKVNHNE